MVFYNLAVIAVNANQHNTTYTTFQSNSVNTTYIAWRLNLTARQFIAEKTFFFVKQMCRLAAPSCLPGGFWVRTQNFRENSVRQKKTHTFIHGST